jgi:hypothetical protein
MKKSLLLLAILCCSCSQKKSPTKFYTIKALGVNGEETAKYEHMQVPAWFATDTSVYAWTTNGNEVRIVGHYIMEQE